MKAAHARDDHARTDDSWWRPLARGWRQAGHTWVKDWRAVLQGKSVVSDVIAGITVAAVALPLNVALARASGMPAVAGLIAGGIGGIVAALFGGTRLQVTGPAAALSTMVLGLANDFGVAGVAAATLVIGVVQLLLAALLAGRANRFVPDAVLAGFTTGVGLKILDQQTPELLGFEMLGKDYKLMDLARMMHAPAWLHHVSWQSVICGLFVAFLVVATQKHKRFPAAILAIAAATFVAQYLAWPIERVGELPSRLPAASLPLVPDERWLDLLVAVLPLALLASVESLLSASALDRMAHDGHKHEPNLELFGQGLANGVVSLFGGMPVTGVIVRSSVNAQAGGKSRLGAIIHGVLLLVATLWLGRSIARIPEAALAGLLLVVGVRLIELKTLFKLVRHERVEAAAFLVTAAGTVSGHLMTGLVGGLALHLVGRLLGRRAAAERTQVEADRARGIRAVLSTVHAEARHPASTAWDGEGAGGAAWVPHVRDRAHVPGSAYVHPKSSVIGRVVLGDEVHVAAGASIRADEGTPFFIGPRSNVQDGVVIHALKDRRVVVGGEEWAVYVGRNVSLAHDALVHGPTYIGDDVFVGFKAVVHDAVIGARSYIGIGAVVVGVEIGEGKLVPHGAIVDSAEAAAALPDVGEAHAAFNEDVVHVNRGLAAAYHEVQGTARRALPPVRTLTDEPEPRAPAAWDEAWGPTGEID